MSNKIITNKFQLNLGEIDKPLFEKILGTSKNKSRELTEYLLYILLRKIKEDYYTHTLNGSENFFILQSYFSDLNLDFNLRPYIREEFISNYVSNSNSLKNLNDLENFLQNYFIFFLKLNSVDIQKFVDEVFKVADFLTNEKTSHLIQTPFINDNNQYELLKSNVVSKFNKELDVDLNFYDISLKKGLKGRTEDVELKFYYPINISESYINKLFDIYQEKNNVEKYIESLKLDFSFNEYAIFDFDNYSGDNFLALFQITSETLSNYFNEYKNKESRVKFIKNNVNVYQFEQTKHLGDSLIFKGHLRFSLKDFLNLIGRLI